MTSQEFNAWRKRWKLTISQAAAILDMGKTQVAHYSAGNRPIPKVVAMACKCYTFEILLKDLRIVTDAD